MYDSIGSEIKKLRKKNNLTQKQLAELTGISEISIRKYENNDRKPKYENIKKIAESLGVNTNDLVDPQGTNKIEKKINSDFKEAFFQFVSDKRYLLDAKHGKYDSVEEYNKDLEELYYNVIKYIEFYCFKLEEK